jgi:hypothetical protein
MTVRTGITRRDFLKIAATALGGAALACGKSQDIIKITATSGFSGQSPVPEAPSAPNDEIVVEPTEVITGPRTRMITVNDFIPEQTNYIDTLVVVANFEDRRDNPFDLTPYWDRIFGTEDPIRQLNAYYKENFYHQLQLRPVEIGPKRYVDIELPGTPQDYSFGWLIGVEDENIDAVDLEEAQRLVLEILMRVVQAHPEIDYQDVFLFMILNAAGAEYGRGAAGALPTGGVDPTYDIFVGNLASQDADKFSNPEYFRILDDGRVIGTVRHIGYTFDDYFNDRGDTAYNDQFIMGVGLFGKDAPLSCASHDILHGLRRKSAYATPPEGRIRAINCLYNLPLQSQQIVGTDEHGRFDRSINCSPYIGWWDPMGDHLHPTTPREFFCSHPHGMSSFTKIRMGMIPDRCIAIVEADEATVDLNSLSNLALPPPGDQAEAMVVKVPMMPGVPGAEHIYLQLEYRRRVEGEHPDNFTITPDYVFGDPTFDPGYNPANPEASVYINPPMQFVSKEGVLVYLVNEKMNEIPVMPYNPDEWYAFKLVLLNPTGHEKRDDLTQVALAAGEQMLVDFNTLYAHTSASVQITVSVTDLSPQYARVQITRNIQR